MNSRPRINTKQSSRYSEKFGNEYNSMETAIEVFSVEMESRLCEVIQEKAAVEARFVKDYRQYKGLYTSAQYAAMEGRSRAFINLTAPKSDIGRSQLGDMLFPNDDSNYGLSATPVPHLAKAMEDNTPVLIDGQQQKLQTPQGEDINDEQGNPKIYTEAVKAKRIQEIADERAAAMKLLIDDQLTEADYELHGRQCLFDGTAVGTGIIKGPYPEYESIPSYDDQGKRVYEQKLVPRVGIVRPWNFFPQMNASTVKRTGFFFERFYSSDSDLKSLVHEEIPGVISENISRIVKLCGSKKSHHATSSLDELRALEDLVSVNNDSNYECWEYNGPMPLNVYMTLAEEHGLEPIEDDSDLVIMPNVMVRMCGGLVYQILPQLLDRKQGELYHVWNWQKSEFSLFGYGLPHKMADAQDAINTAWRQMQDNATLTVGPQIGYRDGKVEPVDGKFEIRPNKLWKILTGSKISDAFESFEFKSHQTELSNIYSLARTFFDEESGVPMISHGENGPHQQTLGGMSMLMNAANTVRREQVRNFDDYITKPLITSFYHFNMEYHDSDDVKGDVEVDARGVSALINKEQQQQQLLALLQLTQSNPIFAPIVQLRALKWLRSYVKTLGLGKDMLPSETELQEFLKKQQESNQGKEKEMSREALLRLEHQLRLELKQLEITAKERLAVSQERLAIYKMRQDEMLTEKKAQAELAKLDLREKHITEREVTKEIGHQTRFNIESSRIDNNIGLETKS